MTASELPGPGFNFAACLGPCPPLEELLPVARNFFADCEKGWGVHRANTKVTLACHNSCIWWVPQRAVILGEVLKFRPWCDDEHGRGVQLPELEREMTDTRELEVINEALAIIDRGLAEMLHRELVSTDEVADLLLDVRTRLTQEAEAATN